MVEQETIWRRRIDALAGPRAQVVLLMSFGILVVMIWFTVFLRVSTGSAAPEAKSPFETATPAASQLPTEIKEAAAGSGSSPTGRTEVFQLKDPFEPVLPPSVPASSGITPETPTATVPAAVPSATTTTLAGITGGASGNAGTGSGSTTTTTTAAPSTGTRVRLDKIEGSGDAAIVTISVNGVPYQVKEGDDFAGNFRLVEIGEETVTLLRGDDRIDLSISEEIIK